MIENESQPVTEPSGALVPPPRKPPTAVGTATPPPPRPSPVPRPAHFPHTHPARRRPAFEEAMRAAANRMLDLADALVEQLEAAARR